MRLFIELSKINYSQKQKLFLGIKSGEEGSEIELFRGGFESNESF